MNDKDHVDPKNTRSEEYRATLAGIASSGTCPAPFCQARAEYHRHETILEGRFWKVTRNSFNYQGAEHAFLIVYKEHVSSPMETVRPESDVELMQIVRSLVRDFKIPGATLMMRFGDTNRTGASVTHLHAHLIAGRERGPDTQPITAWIGFESTPSATEE